MNGRLYAAGLHEILGRLVQVEHHQAVGRRRVFPEHRPACPLTVSAAHDQFDIGGAEVFQHGRHLEVGALGQGGVSRRHGDSIGVMHCGFRPRRQQHRRGVVEEGRPHQKQPDAERGGAGNQAG